MVEAGLPVRSADALKPLVQGMEASALHKIVPEATLRRARRQGKPLSRDASERLYDVARVFAQAETMMGGDRDKALTFMREPNMFLEMRSPFELARSSTAGAQAVLELIGQVRAGVCA